MALPATDTFTAADGTALTTYSASWTLNDGNFAINTNSVHSNAATVETGAHWNADTFNDNQYALGTIVAIGANPMGVAVRAHATAATWYGFYSDTGGSYLHKNVAGVWTQLGSTGAAFSVNDIIRIEVSGATVTPMRNGATISPPGAQTDSAIASGSAGITGYNNSTSSRVDGWEGGNLAGGATSILRQMMAHHGG